MWSGIGEVVDAASANSDVIGVRRMFEAIAREPRLKATAIQTVGAKGWDAAVAGDCDVAEPAGAIGDRAYRPPPRRPNKLRDPLQRQPVALRSAAR